MAQILITHLKETHHYTPIASIKKYSEPAFETKLHRYGQIIFENYHVFKFKFDLTCSEIPGKKFQPDLLLVSKTFKKWVIVEVELCKSPTQHTLDQITCFSNPKFNPTSVVDFLVQQNTQMKSNRSQLLKCVSNATPGLIVVLDDYSDRVFKEFYDHDAQLKLCVLEVYKRRKYMFEGYRFGGDYPYELTNSSKIEYVDAQHFKILKKDFIADLPEEFTVRFNTQPVKATKLRISAKKTYLKIPYHNIPSDVYLEMGKTKNGQFIIQKL